LSAKPNGRQGTGSTTVSDMATHVDCVRLVTLPKLRDSRGSLTVIESGKDIWFAINRAFYLYDIPAGASRGAHAHRTLQEFLVALSGSFSIVTDDGTSRIRHILDHPDIGLYIGPMIWVELGDFSAGSVCLVLASLPYNASDYYHDYDKFLHDKLRLP
jgi:hypothetical protein